METRQPVLIMIQGPEPGSIYKLPDNRVTAIGRSSRNTIRVVSPSISRFHCEVACVNGVWELSDLNSRKGTMINGERVHDKTALTPGDVIRLSTTIFRFDMVDQRTGQTEAITAIKEAELNLKLRPKGEATATLVDIQVRSRLESEAVRHDRIGQHQPRRSSPAFLCVVACAVSVVVAGVLLYGHTRRVARSRGDEAAARAALGEAVAMAQNGQESEAVRRLREIQQSHPGTQMAADAARKCSEVVWSSVQRSLPRVARSEAGGDYAAALGVYNDLNGLGPEAPVQALLARHEEYTVRLAHASFKALQQAAREHVEAGDLDAALKLYRWAGEHIGVAELSAVARQEAAALEKRALR